jgi:hypothetical protein
MSEYDVLLTEDACEFLNVADEKTEWVCKRNSSMVASSSAASALSTSSFTGTVRRFSMSHT